MFNWEQLIYEISFTPVPNRRSHLKSVVLAQAILESGRGSSELFKAHCNPFGLKFRPELAHIASSVSYKGENYCHFSEESFAAQGYWLFIQRKPYQGWENFSLSNGSYIRFILKCGYAGPNPEKQKKYLEAIIRLLPEAMTAIQLCSYFADVKSKA